MSRLMTKTTIWHVRPAKTQISLGICPVWSESLQCTQWVAEDTMSLHADSKDPDQMPRLIWVFTGRKDHFTGFVMRRLNYLKKAHRKKMAVTVLKAETVKRLIRLGGCPGLSESSLGAQVTLLVLSCCRSILNILKRWFSLRSTALFFCWQTVKHDNIWHKIHIK